MRFSITPVVTNVRMFHADVSSSGEHSWVPERTRNHFDR